MKTFGQELDELNAAIASFKTQLKYELGVLLNPRIMLATLVTLFILLLWLNI